MAPLSEIDQGKFIDIEVGGLPCFGHFWDKSEIYYWINHSNIIVPSNDEPNNECSYHLVDNNIVGTHSASLCLAFVCEFKDKRFIYVGHSQGARFGLKQSLLLSNSLKGIYGGNQYIWRRYKDLFSNFRYVSPPPHFGAPFFNIFVVPNKYEVLPYGIHFGYGSD